MSAAPPQSTRATDADWSHALKRPAELSRTQTRLMVATMTALHLGAGWALLQVPAVRQAVLDVAPVMVELLAPPTPQPETLPPPAQMPTPRVQPLALLAVPSSTAVPAEAYTVPPPPPTQPEPAVAAAPAVTLAPPVPSTLPPLLPPAPVAPPAPPPLAPKRMDATAVSYTVEPPVEVPRTSRRAGESGVVWLRVIVDTRGLPKLVQVQRSSGHVRLDEQALFAMRQARFKPHTENGTPIEVEVIAPIEYLLD